MFEEKFTAELDKGWTWVREDPKAWRIDKDTGALVLRTMPGSLHAERNNSKNLLLRPLPKSDKPLAVEVYVEGEPKTQFEHAKAHQNGGHDQQDAPGELGAGTLRVGHIHRSGML